MKRILNVLMICLGVSAAAQISVAGKANLLIPTSSPSWSNFKDAVNTTIDEKGKNNVGFNVGLSLKIDTPTSFFIMPEIYYTNFKNTFTEETTKTEIEAKNSRIDVPVLLGTNLLGDLLSAYIGPVASFNLAKDEDFGNFEQRVSGKDFTVGYQLGLQSEISKLIISARYEGAFSKDQRKFINTVAGSNQEIEYDNRSSLFMLGLGYKF